VVREGLCVSSEVGVRLVSDLRGSYYYVFWGVSETMGLFSKYVAMARVDGLINKLGMAIREDTSFVALL